MHICKLFGPLAYNFRSIPICLIQKRGEKSNASLQLLALEWIHDHIADFGGDPDRVTIMVNIIVFTIFVKTAIIVMSNLAKLASTFF